MCADSVYTITVSSNLFFLLNDVFSYYHIVKSLEFCLIFSRNSKVVLSSMSISPKHCVIDFQMSIMDSEKDQIGLVTEK